MEKGSGAAGVGPAKDAVDRAMRAFTGLLRAGVDPAARVSREWSVRDSAAHVAGFLPMYVAMAEGQPSPVPQLERLAEWNQRFLAVEEQSVYAFADAIDRGMADLLDAVDRRGGDVAIRWHGGLDLPLSAVLGLLAAEGYVHGYDVARTARARWVIPPEDATTIFRAVLPLFPSILDRPRAREMSGTVEVRLRGVAEGPWSFVFAAGELHIDSGEGRPADWVMSAAPTGFLLASYGRLSPLRATLTGRVLGWGRRPSLGLRFGQAFRSF